jgi:hypothetical protein
MAGALQLRGHQKPAKLSGLGRRGLEASGNDLAPHTSIKGAITNGPYEQMVLIKRLSIGISPSEHRGGFSRSSRPVHRLEDLRLDLAF